jgi:hypothetical protein
VNVLLLFAIGQLGARGGCTGAGVHVAPLVQPEPGVPRPPPGWPTITMEVGTLFPLLKLRLFVRLIESPPVAVVGTVITTGDQPEAAGFRLAQVAVELLTAVPQL